MRAPCDEAVMRSSGSQMACRPGAKIWILAATILGSSMAFIDGTIVTVALPALQASFHATVVDLQWVVESYGVLLAALILVGGSLGDHFGRRLIFVAGVLIFALASAACGTASDIHQLIIARSIQGVGAALLVPGSLAIISTSFDEKSRGQAIGTWSGFTAITTAVGPVLGGWLVGHASWRWVFFLNLPIGRRGDDFPLADTGEPQRRSPAHRLVRSDSFHPGAWESGYRFRRITGLWLGQPCGIRKFDAWRRFAYRIPVCRGCQPVAHTPPQAVPIPKLQWREPAHSFSIRRSWDLLLLISLEPDSSPGILGHGNWRCCPTFDSAAVLSFPLVWRTRQPLWFAGTADGRPAHCRIGLCTFRCAFYRR